LKKGRLVRVSQRAERELFTISFDEELVLSSSTATRNRSMELSEMVRYNRNLIAFCDYSGIAYKIDPVTGKTFQRWAIADGNGDEAKPFKGEWATVKDDQVWLGSIGFEWYGSKGEILHRNAEWVKIVDGGGTVRNLNWHPVYQAEYDASGLLVARGGGVGTRPEDLGDVATLRFEHKQVYARQGTRGHFELAHSCK